MYVIGLLLLATLLIWGIESLAHVLKIIGIRSNTPLIGNAFAQSLNIVSRLGYFIQTYIIASLLDRSLYTDKRLLIVISYFVCVLLSTFIIEICFKRIVKLYKYLLTGNLLDIKAQTYTHPVSNKIGGRLQPLALVGYIFLYGGAIAPLGIQLIFPSMAARSIALGAILNGISTIVLISVLDLRIAMNTQNNVNHSLSENIYRSKYYASLTLIIFVLVLIILKK